MSLKFTCWQRSPIYDLVSTDALVQGRLIASLPLTLTDANTGDTATGGVDFHITAPVDIAGMDSRQIIRTAPPANANNAESTKLVHIDFAAADMPWRYTPRRTSGDKLSPWLVLLVGTSTELKIDGQNVQILEKTVLQDHDLSQSIFWAHVQDDGSSPSSRILSPRRLKPETAYIAVLVAAFDAQGAAAWDLATGRQPATLPVFYTWQFWTTEEGDFETLATAILPRKVGNLGRAPLAYRRGDVDVDLEVRGAITTLSTQTDGADEATARADLAQFRIAVDALSASDSLGRTVIGLPRHGRPWVDDLDAAVWTQQLNIDPRFRGTAGLGLWMGIECQQSLVDAAVTQLGAAPMAVWLVSNLATGILCARSLWDRRLPPDSARQVHLFSPLMRRMRTATSNALSAVTGPSSPLEAALFSTAARRMLRRGVAVTRHTEPGFVPRGELIAAANVCPPAQKRSLPGLPHADELCAALRIPELERAVRIKPFQQWSPQQHPPVQYRLDINFEDLRKNVAQRLPDPSREHCEAPNLDFIASMVREAISPHGSQAPAIRRIGRRISGLDISRLEPPEVPVGLDFPTWTLLRDHAKEWLVPGIDQLQKHSVMAMQTNPEFNDAYLLGINTQFLNELHWRRLPIDRRSTPLKMFWGHINYETGKRDPEIQPFLSWPLSSKLGALEHQVLHPGDTAGQRDLIILFRSDLFRRYPSTLVYLVRKPALPSDIDTALLATPVFNYVAADRDKRQFLGPTFQGTITPDIVFFAFDMDPDTLGDYWLILDEPPSELRFRGVDKNGNPHSGTTPQSLIAPPASDPHSAKFALRLIDQHTRVAISGAYLMSLGLEPSP